MPCSFWPWYVSTGRALLELRSVEIRTRSGYFRSGWSESRVNSKCRISRWGTMVLFFPYAEKDVYSGSTEVFYPSSAVRRRESSAVYDDGRFTKFYRGGQEPRKKIRRSFPNNHVIFHSFVILVASTSPSAPARFLLKTIPTLQAPDVGGTCYAKRENRELV